MDFPANPAHRSGMATDQTNPRPRTCLAIDPGVTGAAALVELQPNSPLCSVLGVWDLPVVSEVNSAGKTRRSLDPCKFADFLADHPADILVSERLVAAPGVHAVTAYSLGRTAGTIQAVAALARRPCKLVSPNVWKYQLAVPPDKAGARRFATKYFGHDRHWPRATHHNRAEAALIGVWALCQQPP